LIGPGATPFEIALQGTVAGLGALLAIVVAPAEWPLGKTIVAALFGFDLAGGVVTTTTRPAKLWYHRPGRGAAAHLVFVAAHVVHLAVVAFVFRPGSDAAYFGVLTTLLLVGATAIEFVPERLQRPIAATSWLVAIGVDLSLFASTPGLEWFVPMLFFKLLIGHSLPEEARLYRPGGVDESTSASQRPAST